MSTKEYIIHAAKYFLRLVLLLALIYAVLFLSQLARVGAEEFFRELFATRKGWMMIGMLVLLAATYPKFGFVARHVDADIDRDREEITRALAASGYALATHDTGVMTFRVSSPVRRLTMMYDDRITVRSDGDGVVIEGIRRSVVNTEYRLKSYMINKGEDK